MEEVVDYDEDDGNMEQDFYFENLDDDVGNDELITTEVQMAGDENSNEKSNEYIDDSIDSLDTFNVKEVQMTDDASSRDNSKGGVSNTLFLTRYSLSISRSDLYLFLSKFGEIKDIFMKDRFSYIEFSDVNSAISAKKALHHSGPMLGSSSLGLIADYKKPNLNQVLFSL